MNEPRPIYENARTLQTEKDAAATICERYQCTARKMPRSYRIDWMMLRDRRVVAIAELKVRSNARAAYPEYMIGASKILHGLQLAEQMRVPFLIFVQWNDGLFYHRVGSCEIAYGIGGRMDRGDAEDIEPVALIPVENFLPV